MGEAFNTRDEERVWNFLSQVLKGRDRGVEGRIILKLRAMILAVLNLGVLLPVSKLQQLIVRNGKTLRPRNLSLKLSDRSWSTDGVKWTG
jgi:hypothetical protein